MLQSMMQYPKTEYGSLEIKSINYEHKIPTKTISNNLFLVNTARQSSDNGLQATLSNMRTGLSFFQSDLHSFRLPFRQCFISSFPVGYRDTCRLSNLICEAVATCPHMAVFKIGPISLFDNQHLRRLSC